MDYFLQIKTIEAMPLGLPPRKRIPRSRKRRGQLPTEEPTGGREGSSTGMRPNQRSTPAVQPKQQSAGPMVQCQDRKEGRKSTMRKSRRVSGDRVRQSSEKGIKLGKGTLYWKLEYLDEKPGTAPTKKDKTPKGADPDTVEVKVSNPDVRITVRFVASRYSSKNTYVFAQTVKATLDGKTPDFNFPHLLITRDSGSGAAMDEFDGSPEPFYTAERTADNKSWRGELDDEKTKKRYRLAGPGKSKVATFVDAPTTARGLIPRGQTAHREFELAVISIESGETLGSLKWGYTKTHDGKVPLQGARVSDVRKRSASKDFESARKAFYKGNFQYSLSGFRRGSSKLEKSHLKDLDRLMKRSSIREMVLVGANDNSGSREDSDQLSIDRAEAVKKYLVKKKKVPADKIKVLGHGVHARYPNRRGRRVAKNRRVDIHVSWGQIHTKVAEEGKPDDSFLISTQDPHQNFKELVEQIGELSQTKGSSKAALTANRKNNISPSGTRSPNSFATASPIGATMQKPSIRAMPRTGLSCAMATS